ncbi:hypothetical protein HKX48_001547, partial [Thoreauomyces humboldtii]
ASKGRHRHAHASGTQAGGRRTGTSVDQRIGRRHARGPGRLGGPSREGGPDRAVRTADAGWSGPTWTSREFRRI